jgi:hypothetical protein
LAKKRPPAPIDNVPAVILPNATPLSLNLPDTLTFDQWMSYGCYLRVLGKGFNWWLVEWLIAADRFPKGVQSIADLWGDKGERWLYKIRSVGSRFTVEGKDAQGQRTARRRAELDWSEHAEVAYLPPDTADDLLDQAILNGWNTKDLRNNAKEAKVRLGIGGDRNGQPLREGFVPVAPPVSDATARETEREVRLDLVPDVANLAEFTASLKLAADNCQWFLELAKTPTPEQIDGIMVAASHLIDALCEVQLTCEKCGAEPI